MELLIIIIAGFVYLGAADFVWCGIIYFMFRTVMLRKKGAVFGGGLPKIHLI